MPFAARRLLSLVAIGTVTLPAQSFDVHTHAAMTAAASAQSTFTQSPTASALALKLGLSDPAFVGGKQYFDLGISTKKRDLNIKLARNLFIDLQEPSLGLAIPDEYSLSGWIIQGAIREDDNQFETPDSDEPDGIFNRVFGHFFDPRNNRGLTAYGVTLGDRAVDWALSPNASVFAGIPGVGRQNHFKISDAREAMWRALTLTARDSNGGFTGSPWPVNWPDATSESVRQAYWATTFRALGDVVHLIQDMAQPQHTRNDIHSGYGCIAQSCLGGHKSFFEQYLRARTRQDTRFSLDEGFLTDTAESRRVKADQLTYEGYPKPTFNSYADYFSTGTFVASASGYGLANYSNRGFYSFGTNINSSAALNDYPSPDPLGVGLSQEVVSGAAFLDMTHHPMPQGSLTLVTGTVRDFAVPSREESNVRLSAVGMWDQFLQSRTGRRSYTLNYYNYDDQAKLLVPRAVAYSAGLIDYFFRGQMEISLPDSGVYAIVDHAAFAGSGASATDAVNGHKGFPKIRLRLKNTTPIINAPDGGAYPQEMGAGTLVAVAKFHRNLDYKDNLSGEKDGPAFDPATFRSPHEEILVSQFKSVSSVPSDKSQELEFTFDQEIPINATDLYLQVVFRGALGQEADAVVVATRDIAEPTYITFLNAQDYVFMTETQVALCGPTTHPCNGDQLDGAWQFFRDGPPTPAGASVVFRSLPQRRFSRMAFLTDSTSGWLTVYDDAVSGSLPVGFPYGTSASQLNFLADGSTFQWYSPVKPARGAYTTNTVVFVLGSAGEPTTLTFDFDLTQLSTPLQDLHPLPFYKLTVPDMLQ